MKSIKTLIDASKKKRTGDGGFSLIEVLIGIFLVAVAVAGMAQLYLMSMMNNARSSEIANSLFLAQQQIDYLRTLTNSELTDFPNSSRGEQNDELIDTNSDGTIEFRRLTVLTIQSNEYDVKVMVFPASQAQTLQSDLLADPDNHKVRARMETIITR